MRFKKTISVVLALVVLLLSLMVFWMFQKTQLVMFESVSFNMPLESFEKAFGKPHEIVEETETGYHNPWRAKDPYLYKTGRLFYDYENFKWKSYSGRVTVTFSKSHRLQGATVHIPVTSKVEQKVVLNNLSQTVKKELEELPDYQSMTTDTVGLYDDGYRYKVKLKGQQWELWIDVYPTEDEDAEKTEANKYMIRVDQFLMYP